jgi:hypothetical protein
MTKRKLNVICPVQPPFHEYLERRKFDLRPDCSP